MPGADKTSDKVLIVGGGIAGLTLAITLAESGRTVEVVDIRDTWTVTGWGLSVTGPALRALESVGLADKCIEAGHELNEIRHCAADGTLRATVAPGRLSGPDKPAMIGMFRPVLHDILHGRAEELGAQMRLSTTVQSVDENSDQVKVTFNDGSTGTYDLVVGADGVNSHVRSLIGFDVEPQYTGQNVWRALIDRPEWLTCLYTFSGPVHNAGGIPISADRAYIFVTENDSEVERVEEAELAPMMRELLTPFSGPMDPVRESIVSPDQIVRRPVGLLLADAPWHRGRVVLVGDAAHSPAPQLVSGSALAIEDSVVLAELLASGIDIPEALERFTDRRYERCRLVVETSAQITECERVGPRENIPPLQEQCYAKLAEPI